MRCKKHAVAVASLVLVLTAVPVVSQTLFSRSFDGGQTFLPPAQLSSEPLPSGRLDRTQFQAASTRGVRPLGREAEELLAEARRLSPTVRRLLAKLEVSDVVVHVEVRPSPRPWQPTCSGVVQLIGRGVSTRYLKIEIYDYYVTNPIPWLGHELQHAAEIASAPEVTDNPGMERLYGRIGRRRTNGLDLFETKAATDVRNQVLTELTLLPGSVVAARLPRWPPR